MQTSTAEVITGTYSVEEVKESSKGDLDFFAGLCMPDDATEDYPPIFWQLFLMLSQALVLTRDFSKFAIGLPRGHGKTMFLKLVVAWAIFFTDKKFILIVGASAELAENILSDIVDILDSENCQAIFGNWRANLEIDRKGFKKFTFNGRPVILKAVGAGTAMRGIAVKNKRPDLMLFDDAQTKECAASVAESKQFRSWFRATALKAKNPTGCTFCYVGNMYPDLEIVKGQYTCQLRNLQKSPEWRSYIVGAILADGTALWDQVQPLEQLLSEFRDDLSAGTPEIFFSEVLNDPGAANTMDIDLSKIVTKRPEDGERHQGNFIIIDPANDKDQSDDTAIGYFELFDAVPNLDSLYAERLSGPDLVHKTLELCRAKGCSLVFVEAQAYQYSLVGWFDFICGQLGLEHIHIEPLYTKGRSKNSRILDMFKALMSGDLTLHPRVQSQVILQISRFNRLSRDNEDDILDVMAYAEQVLGNHLDLLAFEGIGEVLSEHEFDDTPRVGNFTPDEIF